MLKFLTDLGKQRNFVDGLAKGQRAPLCVCRLDPLAQIWKTMMQAKDAEQIKRQKIFRE